SEAGEPEQANLVAWAGQIVAMKPVVLEARIRALEALLTTHRETILATESCAEAEARVTDARHVAERLRAELRRVAGPAPAGAASLSELLTHAKGHLEETPEIDHCPVCEQPAG